LSKIKKEEKEDLKIIQNFMIRIANTILFVK
jgi:hypothetical protein